MAALGLMRFCTPRLLRVSDFKGQYSLINTSAALMNRMNIIEAKNVNRRQWQRTFLKEMYQKRTEIGPDKPRRRSDWINWNYDVELYAFEKRLGEEFDEDLLRQAFIHSSYVEEVQAKRADLGLDVDLMTFEMEDNSELASQGEQLISTYIRAYLRHIYPYMFEECITALHDHLMSEKVLAHVSYHLGVEDMMLCQEYPPVSEAALSITFKALVGALEASQSREKAVSLVCDMVIPQLQGQDVNELWPLHNPMGLLVALLGLTGRGEPEPRLLWGSASNTLMANYWVGIYSNKQLLAKAPGESVNIAEEMAAREAIKKVMHTEDFCAPMILGPEAATLNIDYDRVNASAEAVIKKHFEKESASDKKADKV